MAIWTLKRKTVDTKRMAEELNISEIFAQILGNRGIYSKKDAELYIKPRIALMHNAFLMKDLEKAVKTMKIKKFLYMAIMMLTVLQVLSFYIRL